MGKHIDDRTRKRIVADYIECGNYSAVARKYKCSVDSVRRYVAKNKDVARKAKEKKEQNTADMLAYMDGKKQDAMKFIDLALEEMMKPEKLKKSSVQSLATSLGIIVDKFTPREEKKDDNLELFKSIAKVAGNKFEKAD